MSRYIHILCQAYCMSIGFILEMYEKILISKLTFFLFVTEQQGYWRPASPLVPLLFTYYYYCNICCTTVCTRFEGIAKLTPFAAVFDSVFTAVNVGIPIS
jgi:hypothetical protein